MYRFWEAVTEPLLGIVQPRGLVEIGSSEGAHTARLLEYCGQHDAVLHAVDPEPRFDVDQWKQRYGGRFVFHRGLSLEVLPALEHAEVVLIDGDHNWYTVCHELKLLEQKARAAGQEFPLVLLHDVGWPYGRRDLYYEPDRIPEEFRKPWKRKGLLPGKHELQESGGLNPNLAHALEEGGERNGVLTAVEDFLREQPPDSLRLVIIPGFFGLGLLVSADWCRRVAGLAPWLDGWRLDGPAGRLLESLELARIGMEISRQQWEARSRRDEERLAGIEQQLAAALARQRKEQQERAEQAARWEAERARLGQEAARLLETLARREQELARLQQDLQELSADHTRQQQRLREQERLLAELRQEAERREAENRERQRQAEALRTVLAQAGKEVETLSGELTRRDQQARQLTEEAQRRAGLLEQALAQARQLDAALGAVWKSKRWQVGNRLADLFHRLPGVRPARDIRAYVEGIRRRFEQFQKQLTDTNPVPARWESGAPVSYPDEYGRLEARGRSRRRVVGTPPGTVRLLLYSEGRLEPLRRALLALRRWTDLERHSLRVMVAGCDGERFSRVEQLCRELGPVPVEKLTGGQGYFAALKKVAAEGGDLCLLRETTVVSPGWLEGLQRAAYAFESPGLVSPFSTAHPLYPFDLNPGDNLSSGARKLRLLGDGQYPVAFPHFDTVYQRGELLAGVAAISAADGGYQPFLELTARLIEKNRLPVLADDTLVAHSRRFGALTRDRLAAELAALSAADRRLLESLSQFTAAQKFPVREAYRQSAIRLVDEPCLAVLLNTLTLCGGVLILTDLIDELVLAGVDVKVVLRQPQRYERQFFDLLAEPVAAFDAEAVARMLPPGGAVLATFWNTAQLAAEVVQRRPDVQGYYFVQDYEVDFYDPHKPEEKDHFTGAAQSYFLPLRQLTTSGFLVERIRRHLGRPEHEIVQIGCGPNLELFYRTDRPMEERPLRLIAMARPETPRRGFEVLARVLERVKRERPEVEIFLFGSRSLSQLDLPFDFHDLGVLGQEQLVDAYRRSDIFIDTSHFQGFGLPALEAMACGCACVLTQSGGVAEYAVDGENALLAPPGDSEALAGQVLRLIADAKLRAKLQQAGWQTARRFPNHAVAAKVLQLLERQAAERRKAIAERTADRICNIVIPVYNQPHVVRPCLESVARYTPAPFRCYVVDDASDRHTAELLQRFCAEHDGFFYLRQDSNQGFVASANRGLGETPGGDIVLLNSDVMVTPGWLEKILRCADSDPKIGIISPLSTSSSHLWLRLNAGDSILDAACQIEALSPRRYPDVVTPEGWCFFIRRELYERLGPFDTIYGRGYCEESDYCMQALANGWRLVCCDDVFIYHHGRATFGEQRGSPYQHNRAIFDRRWKPLYEKVYRAFLQADPLAEVRRRYGEEARWARVEDVSRQTFPSVLRILEDPGLEKEAERFREEVLRLPPRTVDRPRLVFLLSNLSLVGGILSVSQLVNDLLQQGLDVKVAVLTPEDYSPDVPLLVEPIFFRDDSEFLEKFPPADIVVGTLWITLYYVMKVFLRRRDFLPAYFVQDYEVDFYPPEEERIRACIGQTYRLTPYGFAKTAYLKEKVKSAGGRLALVPPALDLDVFYPRPVEKGDKKRLLAMLRPSTPYRGFKTILEVIGRLAARRQDFEFHAFGCRDEELGQLDFPVVNHGLVPNHRLPELYSSATAFLDFSDFHGFGRTVAEALACGVPAVVTDSGGVRSFVRPGENALVAPPGDIEGLVAALDRLLDDDRLRGQLAARARPSVLPFDRRRSAEETLRVLKGFLAGRRPD